MKFIAISMACSRLTFFDVCFFADDGPSRLAIHPFLTSITLNHGRDML